MRVLTSAPELEQLSSDAGMIRIKPIAGWLAESEQEVVEAVARADSEGTPLTPRGGGTSIPSQSVGKGVILLQKMSGTALSPGSVRCQPALVKSDLNAILDRNGTWMPVDPSSYRSCTIGGMVANNSSGVRSPKYGSTIDHVDQVRVVVPEVGLVELKQVRIDSAMSSDSRIVRRVAELLLENQGPITAERPMVTKNSSGYRLERVIHDGVLDLPKLFVGSEGTLGVLVEATVRTSAKPEGRILFIAEASLDEVGSIVSAFRTLKPTAVELVDKKIFREVGREKMVAPYSRSEGDYLVFCEFDGSGQGMPSKVDEVMASKAGGYDPIVLTSKSDISQAWEVRNETLALAQEMRKGRRVVLPGVEDLVVPPERLTDLISLLRDQFEGRGLSYISYGHAADANLHSRPLLDPDSQSDRRTLQEIMEECFEAVWRMHGSMTGEHGDGMLRAGFVEKQYPKTYSIMKEIKEVFDPKGILNPGVKIAR